MKILTFKEYMDALNEIKRLIFTLDPEEEKRLHMLTRAVADYERRNPVADRYLQEMRRRKVTEL